MSIDTVIDGDPASMQACGEWLKALPEEVRGVAGALQSARQTSEWGWMGSGGDAFRNHTVGVVRAADDLADDVDRLANAFTEFADGLSRAKDIMDDARDIAASAGLLAGDLIVDAEPPGTIIGPMDTPERLAARDYNAQEAIYDAYRDAVARASDARSLEKRTHDGFTDAVKSIMGNIDSYTTNPVWISVGAASSYVNTAGHQYFEWTKTANERAGQMARFIELADGPRPAVPRSASTAVEAFGPAARQAAATAEQNARLIGPLASMPQHGKIMTLLAGNVDKLPPAFPLTSRFVKPLPVSLTSKLPVIGVVVTTGQTAYEIADGADPTRTVLVNGGGLAGGIGGAALLAGIAGTPALVVVGGSIAVSYGVSWAIGEIYDAAKGN